MTDVRSLRPVRQDYITEMVIRDGAVEISTLSAELGVSAATIRRDIDTLEQCGLVRRVHGGAVRAGSGTEDTGSTTWSSAPAAGGASRADVAALAAVCAAEVLPGATVAVSGGSTASEVARAVARAGPARIVTHDLAVVRAVREAAADATTTTAAPPVDVCIPPGILTRRGTVVGPAAVRALVAAVPHVAFIGAAAVHGDDVLAADHWEAEICQALVACASRTVLLADAATLQGTGLVTFATLTEFSAVLTGSPPSHPHLRTRPPGISRT